jgi:hypothetical protein
MFVEITLPFYMVFPRALRAFAGCCFVIQMLLIHLTGNHGFLNLIILLLALMWIDDRSWSFLIPAQYRRPRPPVQAVPPSSRFQVGGGLVLFFLWAPLLFASTFPPGKVPLWNPWSPLASWIREAGLCNHYAFASVIPRMRLGFEVQGSRDGQTWKPYTLRYQPSNPFLPPRYANLHMPRLDQNAWLASMTALSPEGQPPPPWVRRWMDGLLVGHPATLSLMGSNPFSEGPPVQVRILLSGQRFADPVSRRRNGRWWNSRFAGLYAQAAR